jgi:hypothetical protein
MSHRHPSSASRRTFLASSAALAATLVLPRGARGAAGPLQRVNLGLVGCGWRGGQLLEAFQKLDGVTFTGLCDPDQERLEATAKSLPKRPVTCKDMRRLFESPDVDAVVIANPNHWHCLSAIWAMQAGKDVYVEKPLGQTQWEAQQLVNAVGRYGRVCQVGTQQRSDPMQVEIRNLLHVEQLLGPIERVSVNRLGERKPIGKRERPLRVPSTIDFDLWTGPARLDRIFRSELQYDWHWDWNTGSGEMGNWGVHLLDDVRGTVFLDRIDLPDKVAAVGGRYTWDDAGNTPNLQFALFEAGGIPVQVAVCNLPKKPGAPGVTGPATGYVVACEGGRLEGERGRAVAFDARGKVIRRLSGNSGDGVHQANFIDAVRAGSGKQLAAPAAVGFASTGWCNLANIATRVNQAATAEEAPPSDLATGFSDEVLSEASRYFRRVAESHLVGAGGEATGLTTALAVDAGGFTGPLAPRATALLRREDRRGFEVPEVQRAAQPS